ncbi:MAG: polyprenol phosphomannose-dependent alpha 1,6 mannosyltransferase MptB [Actinobacteria bacterium]|nr:polyprenol phosphomannose-dependent alpha 1,6 mannosyltransferase MptB [Actinomycetota bacterium]
MPHNDRAMETTTRLRSRGEQLISDVRVIGAVGLLGSLLMAVGAIKLGAGRTSDPALPAVLPAPHEPWFVAAYAPGFCLLVLGWLLLGHESFRSNGAASWRAVRRIGLFWSIPFLVSTPIGSRDLWAYAAQGNEIVKGFDPYHIGPRLAGGAFNQQVTQRWLDVPSPYGPFWLSICRVVREVAGSSPLVNVVVLRLFAEMGLVLLAFSLPSLALRLGGSPARALWIVVANPLFLVHGVSGGHNDMLMVGLVSAGLWAATSRRDDRLAYVAAGVLIGLAGLIKVPALVALIFVPALRARARQYVAASAEPAASAPLRFRSLLPGLVQTLLAGAVTMAIVNLASGLNLGWIKQASAQNHGGGPARLVLMVLIVLILWERSRAWHPATMLGCAYAAIIFLTPVSEWWYWTWPVAVGAVVLTRRLPAGVLVGLCLTLLLIVGPNGEAVHQRIETIVAGAFLAAWLVFDRTWRPQLAYVRERARRGEPQHSPATRD